MLLRLLLLVVVFALVELAILYRIGMVIGLGRTILLVMLIGLLGAWLARREGIRAFHAIQSELAAGKLPGDRIVDAMLVFVAGVLLIMPGLVSDLLGIALLLPPLRRLIRDQLRRRMLPRFIVMRRGGDDFIDIEPTSAYDRRDDAPRLE